MKKHFLTFLIIVLVIPAGELFAQRDHEKIADNIFGIGEYYEAIDKYKKAYAKEKNRDKKNSIIFKTGLCYRLINDTRRAEGQFRKAVSRKYNDPLAVLYLADALKMNEKYDEAIIEYENYQKLVPDDIRGEIGINSCKDALEWIKNPTRYNIENEKAFNTRSSDFSPAYLGSDINSLVFTSSRESSNGKKTHGVTGESFTDIFLTKLDRKGKWSEPTPLGEKVNTEYDDGVPSFGSGGSKIYFTRCRYDKAENLGCQIMVSQKDGKAWADPTTIQLAADSLVSAHPSVSPDETKMLFAGNLPDGIGGNDIWLVERGTASDSWGSPINLGEKINTPGNEMYPFFKNDSLIYFSSDGLPGMGGLDIFRAFKSGDSEWQVENMKVPINSAADDFGICFAEGLQEKGYFTSSRSGGRGSDDIYSFLLPLKEFKVHGLVIDEKTEEYIKDANVKLIGSDGTNLEVKTETSGAYKFDLKPDTDYILLAVKENYLNAKARETTMGFEENKDFNVNLVLAPIEKSIVLPNINYEFAKWDLRPESLVELDKLVETLNDNPNIRIELSAHTDSRAGINFDNQELSQRRAQSVVNYLILKNIASARLEPMGYAATMPSVVNVKIARENEFLHEGDTLNEEYINSLTSEDEQEIAHQLNRRTEFKVISTSYVPRPEDRIVDDQAPEKKELINIRKVKSTPEEIEAAAKQRRAFLEAEAAKNKLIRDSINLILAKDSLNVNSARDSLKNVKGGGRIKNIKNGKDGGKGNGKD